ncbi:MAG: aldo/keto reductase [Rhodoglobus sp.]|nr:aldo/keto reductase [Rhodoglobus sp.]
MAEVPRLGYGAANVGNLYRALSDEAATAVLDAAWESGIRYYDTAPHYGLGLSERRLGAFLATKPREEYFISTKVGRLLRPVPNPSGRLDDANDFAVPADLERVFDLTADGVRRSLDESLERLGLDRVDALYLHDPEKAGLDAAEESAYPALIGLRDAGLVDHVGVGSMSIEALERASAFAGLDLLMVAGRLTLAEQPALDRVVPQALAHGMQLVAAGVFNSGLLATNTPGGRYEYGSAPEELLARARSIAEVCAQFGVTLPAAALQYTLRIPPVVSVVVGGSRPEQVVENARRMAEDIPEDLWDALARAALIP